MARVYLAVGHGDKPDGTHDPGTVGGKWTEQTAGDFIVDEAAKVLEAAGVTVYSEANTDDPNFPGTTRQANEWDADYVVSIHHDWIKAPTGAFGHWVSSAGKALADDIYSAVGDAGFPLRSSWHKKRTDLYILKNTKAPCVLFEVGRIGQDDLDTEVELRDMGRAIAAGIARHLNIDLEKEEPVAQSAGGTAVPDRRLFKTLVEAEIRRLRDDVGLDPDPESDELWSVWISTGRRTYRQAHKALREKKENKS